VTKLNATGSALVYSTYFGSTVASVAVDSAGDAYVTGFVSASFPTTSNAYWPTNSTQSCASGDFFLSELSPAGTQLVYSTCFNASLAGDAYSALGKIAIDGLGKAYVVGQTIEPIPMTANAYQPSQPPGLSAFAVVVDTTASGSSSLMYSTYLGGTGGNSSASAVAVDSFGKFYLTGRTLPGFPTTPGSYQPAHAGCAPSYGTPDSGASCLDAFVVKLDPNGSGPESLIYSTYVGGTSDEEALAIAVDSSGSAYITGDICYLGTFPITPASFKQRHLAGVAPLS